MRGIGRVKAQPHPLTRIDGDAVRLKAAGLRHGGHDVYDAHTSRHWRRFLQTNQYGWDKEEQEQGQPA
jgi:hypothetical protein